MSDYKVVPVEPAREMLKVCPDVGMVAVRRESWDAIKRYAGKYLIDEFENKDWCIDAEQHDAVIALFEALKDA